MKNCFMEYLTEECKTCEFWRNTVNQCGCAYPGPIDNCEAFRKIYESNNHISNENEESD